MCSFIKIIEMNRGLISLQAMFSHRESNLVVNLHPPPTSSQNQNQNSQSVKTSSKLPPLRLSLGGMVHFPPKVARLVENRRTPARTSKTSLALCPGKPLEGTPLCVTSKFRYTLLLVTLLTHHDQSTKVVFHRRLLLQLAHCGGMLFSFCLSDNI